MMMTAAAADPEDEEEIHQQQRMTIAADPFTNIDNNRKRILQPQRPHDQQQGNNNINRKHQDHRRREEPAKKAATAIPTSLTFPKAKPPSIIDGHLPLPLADWSAVHDILTLIRTQQFGKLYETTNYPFPQRRRKQQQQQQYHYGLTALSRNSNSSSSGRSSYGGIMTGHHGGPAVVLPRSRETVVPGTRSVRTKTGYRYYDTMTQLEISAASYQQRYERVLLVTKMDWSRYFDQLRWQKSMAKTAGTVGMQLQRAHQIYVIHLTELQYLHYHPNDENDDDDDDHHHDYHNSSWYEDDDDDEQEPPFHLALVRV
jgi:hypothetical protein